MSTKIEWVINPDGTKGETWPVVTGCTPVSEGCRNCYAARMAATRLKHHPRYAGLAVMRAPGMPRWTGEIRLNHDVLERPLHWKKPRMVFVASMGDLFHKGVPFEFIDLVFLTMTACNGLHTFQVLTKRPERALEYFNSRQYYSSPQYHAHTLSNVWLGISVENQEQFDSRWYWASQIPAAVLFVNCEPLLALVKFNAREWERSPDWVICGGESGPGARPIHPDWARSLRDQCQAAEVPFFFKQWGAWLHESQFTTDEQRDKGLSSKRCEAGDGYQFVHISKKRAGHLLDGREHLEFPVQPKDIIR